jgi:Holliday junction resolvase RusA-like endonuclease
MIELAQFDVLGLPKPQGSKKLIRAGGKTFTKEASDDHASWRNQVAEKSKDVAAAIRDEWGQAVPLDGALGLSIRFRFPMPKSAPKRDGERRLKISAPDLSKLVRAIEDGLQAGGLIRDDARFAVYREIRKVEVTSWTGAEITITREVIA